MIKEGAMLASKFLRDPKPDAFALKNCRLCYRAMFLPEEGVRWLY